MPSGRRSSRSGAIDALMASGGLPERAAFRKRTMVTVFFRECSMSLPILPELVLVVLAGRHVRLEPLSRDHHAGLCAAGLPGSVFRWFPHPVRTPDDMAEFIDASLTAQAAGTALPF